MSRKNQPTPEVLRELLNYDPESGKLFWRVRGRKWFSEDRPCSVWNARYAGREAFTAYDAYGYKQGNLFNTRTKAHRLIWAYVTGRWPDHDIDHINGIRDDNRIENLRSVTRAKNLQNTSVRKDNQSGRVGVSLMPKSGRWRARIKDKTIGIFSTFDEAVVARKAAESAYGFHQNHGREATS